MANEYTYTPVTNTHKINAHFALCKDEPLIIQQGSQGASKTVSDLMLIIDWFRNNPSKEITICSSEKTKLMDTAFNDLKKICLDWNIWHEFKWNDVKTKLTSPRGTGFIEFIGLDKDDIGKGRRRDLIYINECNKVSHQKYFDISQRAKKVLVDFNADKRFYIHDLINDKNFIQLDFRGNEKLSKEEVRNILSYKAKGYLLDENGDFVMDNGKRVVINEFYANKWRVYGEGEIGSVEGRIYYWQSIDYIKYLNIDSKVYYGVDWGKVDPFAIIEAKYHDGNLYIHERHYKSEDEVRIGLTNEENKIINQSENESLVTYIFSQLGIDKKSTGICDNNYKSKISAIQQSGWESFIGIGSKWKNVDRIDKISNLNVFYTDCSKNLEFEQFNYCYAKDKFGRTLEEPIDGNDHLINATEYLVQDLYMQGVIKK